MSLPSKFKTTEMRAGFAPMRRAMCLRIAMQRSFTKHKSAGLEIFRRIPKLLSAGARSGLPLWDRVQTDGLVSANCQSRR